MPSRRLAAALFCLCAAASPSLAAEPAAGAADDAQESRMETLMKDNPEAQKLNEMAQELYGALKPPEMQRLVILRSGLQMVRAVDAVHEDVEATVGKCGAANPSLKKTMDARFSAWEKEVMPVADAQEKRMKASISKNNFSNPEEIRAFLDQLDKTAAVARERQKADMVPLTTADACQALVKSMDKSGGQLTGALKQIVWPGDASLREGGMSKPE